MDASQYKDYVLVLLFINYVSDKYAGQPFAAITVPKGASFKDMVDRLTNASSTSLCTRWSTCSSLRTMRAFSISWIASYRPGAICASC